MDSCTTCQGETQGFKCDMCDSESDHHVADHQCGGDHCMPKCSGCGEAQVKCSCSA